MTWDQLLLLLTSFKEQKHSAMDDCVTILWDNTEYYVDIAESLTKGSLILIPIQAQDEDDGSED